MVVLAARKNNAQAVALHEAGHAVAAVLLAPDVKLVRVAVLGRGEGTFQTARLDGRRGLECRLVVLHAGRLAELLAGQDPADAWNSARDDRDGMGQALDELGLAGAARGAALGRAEGRAHGLLVANWRHVEAVAAALLAAGELSGGDVERLVGRG